jgi:hypothetical protein
MFAGLSGPDGGIRRDDAGHDELTVIEGSGPFGPAERPMTGYLALPAAWRASPDVAASLGGARTDTCPVDAAQDQEAEASWRLARATSVVDATICTVSAVQAVVDGGSRCSEARQHSSTGPPEP